MNNLLKRVKKIPWALGQTLTQKPRNSQSTISDLFIWRYNKNWNTYFELLDLASLFGEKNQHQVDIIFFDESGRQFYQKSIELSGLYRQVLDISKLLSTLSELPSDYGTFCVFHKKVPNSVLELQSFIAERGYVSYQYKNAPLRSYVHGNLDAIDDSLVPLSGSSFLNRQYNLQYLLDMKKTYEISLINASSKNKKIKFKIVETDNTARIKESVILKPKQVFVFPIKDLSSSSRLIIESKIIMARPIVFCFGDDNMDVFHG